MSSFLDDIRHSSSVTLRSRKNGAVKDWKLILQVCSKRLAVEVLMEKIMKNRVANSVSEQFAGAG